MLITNDQFNTVVNGLRVQLELQRDLTQEKIATIHAQGEVIRNQRDRVKQLEDGTIALGGIIEENDRCTDMIRQVATGEIPIEDASFGDCPVMEAVVELRRTIALLATRKRYRKR